MEATSHWVRSTNIQQATAEAQLAATSDSSIAFGVGHQRQSVPLAELPHSRRDRPTLPNQQRVGCDYSLGSAPLLPLFTASVQEIRRRSQTLPSRKCAATKASITGKRSTNHRDPILLSTVIE